MKRPQTRVVLAMTADGKIADKTRSAARFGSAIDKAHLEKQISLVDGVIFGAGTLRAYGTSLPISDRNLLENRAKLHLPPQPIHIVCSASGNLDPKLRFFSQPIPRWLLTTPKGAKLWQDRLDRFDRILVSQAIDWIPQLAELAELGLKKLAILGGGKLVASLLTLDLIDEFYITVCPLILGGSKAPTPVEGIGLDFLFAKKLQLVGVDRQNSEVFLHYRLQH